MPFDSRVKPYLSTLATNERFLCMSFGVHSSLTAAGIPANRAVFLNTEARDTNGETLTDSITVGYGATAGATTTCVGVVKDGYDANSYSDLTMLPGFNRDFNVTVTSVGNTEILEVAPGAAIAVGAIVQSDTVGRAAATGTATSLIAMTASTGAGTATNPEYIKVLIK